MRSTIKFASSVTVGASLLVLFLLYFIRCVEFSNWSDLSRIELAIVVTQILRVAVVAALNRRLQAQPIIPVILFSLEVFLIPVLALLAFLTSDSIYTTWMADILTTWLGVSSLILTPFVIYEFTRSMAQNESITSAFLIGTLELGGLLYLCETLLTNSSTIKGPAALGTLMIQLGKTQVSSISFNGGLSSELIAISMVAFSVGIISYITLGNRRPGSQVKISDTLLLPLAGTVVAIIWMFAILSISSDVLFVFTVPTIVGAVILWGVSIAR